MESTNVTCSDSFVGASRLFEEIDDGDPLQTDSLSVDNEQSTSNVAQQRTFGQSLSCDSLQIHKSHNTNLKVYTGKKKQIQTYSDNEQKFVTTPIEPTTVFDRQSNNQLNIGDENQTSTILNKLSCNDVEMKAIDDEMVTDLNEMPPLHHVPNDSNLSLQIVDDHLLSGGDLENASRGVSAAVTTPNLSREVKQLKKSVKESKILTEFMNTKLRQKRTKPNDDNEARDKQRARKHRSKSDCLNVTEKSSPSDRRRSQSDVFGAKYRHCRSRSRSLSSKKRSRSRSSIKRSMSRSSKRQSHDNIYNSDSDDESEEIFSKKKAKRTPSKLPPVQSLPKVILCE